MKDELITFETAKLAKNKGFTKHIDLNSNDKCYTPDGNFYEDVVLFQKPKRCKKRGFVACTQSLLQKWLRDEHNIHIHIDEWELALWYYKIRLRKINNPAETIINREKGNFEFKSYEKALEAGLQHALKLIELL